MNLPPASTIRAQVKAALEEDLGGQLDLNADITAQLIDKDTRANAVIISREDCVVCGQAWVDQAFALVDPTLNCEWHVSDGQRVSANTPLVTISGLARGILIAERTALNFLQTLSATATTTHSYASILNTTRTAILDTRKTIPGMRLAQKYAVTCGGGTNHRIGLYDAYLIKENHIFACGGIANAVTRAKQLAPGRPVEVEVESLDELKQAIEANADIVMLDNFDNEQVQSAVALNNGRCKLEVSGNITDERLSALAQLGVDYVSSGALTKHIRAIDLSLRLTLDES